MTQPPLQTEHIWGHKHAESTHVQADVLISRTWYFELFKPLAKEKKEKKKTTQNLNAYFLNNAHTHE